jgi:hypothetical protein
MAEMVAANFAMLRELPGAATTAIATLIECSTNPLISSPCHVAPPFNLIAFQSHAGGSAIGELIVQPPPTAPGSIDPCQ